MTYISYMIQASNMKSELLFNKGLHGIMEQPAVIATKEEQQLHAPTPVATYHQEKNMQMPVATGFRRTILGLFLSSSVAMAAMIVIMSVI